MAMDDYFMQLAEQIETIRCRKYEALRRASMRAEVRTIEFWRSVICECLSTFFYVFFSVTCTLPWENSPSGVVYTAVVHGVTIATLVQCFGHISGGHMNPAVTLPMMACCKITPLRGFLYLLAQSSGGIAGAALIYGMVPSKFRGDMGVATIGDDVTVIQSLGILFVTTFLFVLTFFATVDPNRPTLGSQPLAVGLSMMLGHLVGTHYSNCAINPARALGPAFITSCWKDHWVFWVGPLLGGCFAGLLYEYVFDPSKRGRSLKQSTELLVTEPVTPTSCNSFVYNNNKAKFRRSRSFTSRLLSGNGHENRGYAYDTAPQYDYEMDRLQSPDTIITSTSHSEHFPQDETIQDLREVQEEFEEDLAMPRDDVEVDEPHYDEPMGACGGDVEIEMDNDRDDLKY